MAYSAALRKKFPRLLLQTGSLLISLLLWEIAATRRLDLGFVTFAYVPTPGAVLASARRLCQAQVLLPHLGSSLSRVLIGYLFAALAGIVLGLAVGRSRRAEAALLPTLEMLRPIPAVAWIPLAILMFPSSELSMIFITFTGAFFPILLSTAHGVETVDKRLVASARSLGATPWAILREVILPGAAPGIITGLTIGMGTSWFCLITAEMIAGQWGIGYYTWQSYIVQNYADIVVGMLSIGLLGMGSSLAVRHAGSLFIPWYQLRRNV